MLKEGVGRKREREEAKGVKKEDKMVAEDDCWS